MSIFPTKILLATDGAEEATLATQTATDLRERTGSELHVVHVGRYRPPTILTDTDTALCTRRTRERLDNC